MTGLILGLIVALVWAFALITCFNKMFQKQMRHEIEKCKKLATEKQRYEKMKIMGEKNYALDLPNDDCDCVTDK
jgi:hypothetical protein